MDVLDDRVEPELTPHPDEAAGVPAASGAAAKDGDGAIIEVFRSAARLTAQTLLLEAETLTAFSSDHQGELEQEQSLAVQELSEGDAKALAFDDETAIRHYRKAWLHASSARLHALRTR